MKQHTTIDWTAIRQRLRASELAMKEAMCPSEQTLRAVFDRRAERLAQAQAQAANAQDVLALLVFMLGTDRFAFELKEVAEVGPLRLCRPVPGAPAKLRGVISHRGEVRSVIDLGQVLGRPSEGTIGENWFLYVRAGGKETRLRVDAVDQTFNARTADLIAPKTADLGPLESCVKAIHREGIIVLSGEAVCDQSAGLRERPPAGPANAATLEDSKAKASKYSQT